jgi:hypothetical protein
MLGEKLYFDLKRQTPFQCIFEGKIAIFLFVSGLYLGDFQKNEDFV